MRQVWEVMNCLALATLFVAALNITFVSLRPIGVIALLSVPYLLALVAARRSAKRPRILSGVVVNGVAVLGFGAIAMAAVGVFSLFAGLLAMLAALNVVVLRRILAVPPIG